MKNSCSLFFALLFLNIHAQNADTAQTLPQLIGIIDTTADFLQVRNSAYLNFDISLSHQIRMMVRSIPEVITIETSPVSELQSLVIEFRGLPPNSLFHIYVDSLSNHFTEHTGTEGHISLSINPSIPHLIILQPRPSTLFLKDDGWYRSVLGGESEKISDWTDSLEWDKRSRVALIKKEIRQTIEVTAGECEIRGTGEGKLQGSNTNGLFIVGRRVTVSDLSFSGFATGLSLYSDSNIVRNCIFSQCNTAVYVSNNYGTRITGGNLITGNRFTSNTTSVQLYSPQPSVVELNFINAGVNGVVVRAQDICLSNFFQNVTNSITLVNARGSLVKGNIINGGDYGLTLQNSQQNIITRNIFDNSRYSVSLSLSSQNRFLSNKFNSSVQNVKYFTNAELNWFSSGPAWRGNWWSNHQYSWPYYPKPGDADNYPYVFSWGRLEDMNYESEGPFTIVTADYPPDGPNGWYNSNPRIRISSTENSGGVGFWKTVYYETNSTGYFRNDLINSPNVNFLATQDGITAYTAYGVDFFGNAGNPSMLIIKKDQKPPVPEIAVLPELKAEGVIRLSPPTAQDELAGKVIGSTNGSMVLENPGSYEINWVYDDKHGNKSYQLQKATVLSVTAPAMPALKDLSAECAFTITAPVIADDIVDGSIAGMCSAGQLPAIVSGLGEHVIYWTFTNSRGASTIGSQKITIIDTTYPIWSSFPNDTVIEASRAQVAVSLAAPLANDNCGSVDIRSDAPDKYSLGTTKVTFSARDIAGNVSRRSVLVTIKDNTPPVVPVLDDIRSECDLVISKAPLAADLVDGSISAVSDQGPLPLLINGLGEHIVNWSFTDQQGNISRAYQKIIIFDQTAPVFVFVPADTVIEATGKETTFKFATAVADDNCGTASVFCDAPDTFQLGMTTVFFTATDLAGNTTTDSAVVNVKDQTPPLVSSLKTDTVECSYTVTRAPEATDLVDGKVAGTADKGGLPLTFNELGEHTIVWSFTDSRGNTSTATQKIVVVDRTPPSFTSVPRDTVLEASGNLTSITLGNATAFDNCGTAAVSSDAPSAYPIGATKVNFTAVDRAGNRSNVSVTVTVQDQSAPSVPVLPDLEGECSYTVTQAPEALDLVDGKIAGTADKVGLPFTFNELGEHTIVWSFSDSRGNTSTATQKIVVVDRTPPSFTSVPRDTVLEASGNLTSFTLGNATAFDNCGTAAVSSDAPSAYPIGATKVNFTAVDRAGNRSNVSVTVTVQDRTAPAAPKLSDLEGECSYTVTQAPEALDLVDGKIAGTADKGGLPFTFNELGEHTIVWSFSDSRGNTSTAMQWITIVDSTVPTISEVPDSLVLIAEGTVGAQTTIKPLVSDNCDVAPILSSDAPSLFSIGSTIVHFEAIDKAGNRSSAQTIVRVHYDFRGFESPLGNDGSSERKSGSTVPVKFKLLSRNGQPIGTAVVRIFVAMEGSSLFAPAECSGNSAVGNLFRYDGDSDHYIYNMSTKGMAEGNWVIKAVLDDGTAYTCPITLR